MTRSAVIGGSGFLGSHIADALTQAGHDVVVVDRRPSPYLAPGQRMVVADILDFDAMRAAVGGCDHVYHLAGLADLNAARSAPLDTARLNVLGTVNVLEAAREAGARRLLFASTVYVYSREGSFYRCSKQAGEAYVEEYQREYGLEYTILRYGSLYGPRADETNGMYALLRQAVTTGRVRYLGTPEDVREYIHVEDAARLSVDVLDPAYANQPLVLTGSSPMRAADLFAMFSEMLGRPLEVEYDHPPAGETHGHYRVTPYAFQPKPGRKLTTPLHVDMGQGLLQVIEHLYRSREAGDGRFEDFPRDVYP